MPYPHDEAKLKSWETALSAEIAEDPAPWDEYDVQIKLVCSVYDKHLAGVGGYVAMDWQVIKAIAWVESGAVNAAWKTAPMQIGVNGDPGLRELLTSPAGKLIVPEDYKKVLTVSNVPVNGNLNFEAGVGYVLKITAMFGMVSEPVPVDFSAMLKAGLDRQASAAGLAQQAIALESQRLGLGVMPPDPWLTPLMGFPNASASGPSPMGFGVVPASKAKAGRAGLHHSLHQLAKTKKAVRAAAPRKHLEIVGWKPRTLAFIAKHYNAGDGNYADKLQFALDIISGKVKPEAAPKPAAKGKATKNTHVPLRLPQPGGGHA